MKRRKQALLLLRKAAQDEALLDHVMNSKQVSDEFLGFHCQQAAVKILKAWLSETGVLVRKAHDIGMLIGLAEDAGFHLPTEFANLDKLTPFASIYRYEDYEESVSLNRKDLRRGLHELRLWVENNFRERTALE